MGQKKKKRKVGFLLEFAYVSIREYGSQEGGEIADHSKPMVDGHFHILTLMLLVAYFANTK